ncbi:MAG TPA: insulinase family protein [Methylomusa anaerophila]|uniref:Peptidase M16C associated n=1 Tax=Methylomusa anaerophila TaxID=1930071 RepID=A0A348AK82_9FIRM|nr:insulinase family protein [Methylomusa anaerophila]BBB91480.1 peptidase M16C associated [Methylomusa anaerophila]HML89931.1 insulinase family protein [Methylomusa anaerophila]
MSLTVGDVNHGFELIETNQVTEINSTAKLFEHKKSGARLLYLENDDDNKVFSISFRTPPADSTGVPHIIEHSVLCGSRKFPMKEPFVELVKGSLNTFLNAMTFPDKTMYPVASRNNKDFRNLMDVYLDAVFHPKMVDTPAILMQEGWHYELESPAAPLTYKGVVYNEMKGVFSSPDAILERKVSQELFPDTAYGEESGGDPDDIPCLTQAEFVAFFRKYYHPANSYIFLYGDLDILDTLKFLDEAYLKDFERTAVNSAVTVQAPFKSGKEASYDYPVSPNEPTKEKTYLSLNYVVGKAIDPEVYLGFMILEHLLLETPAAPLKQALLNAGLGKEVFGSYAKSMLQPVFSVGVSGSEPDRAGVFKRVIHDTLQNLVNEGIDKKLIESSINIFEFHLREANFGSRPKGLVYNMKCMDSWLYDESPLMHLAYEPTLEKIKTAVHSPYFETMIQKYLLANSHQAMIVLKPKPCLSQAKTAELERKLAEYKATLSAEQLKGIMDQTKSLKERQETPDPAEILKLIPLLDLQDIESKAEELPLIEKKEAGVPVLFHPIFTNRIGYVGLYFDVSAVPQELLPYVYLLAEILGKVDTSKYNYTELSKEINIHTGGFCYNLAAFSENGDDQTYHPKFIIKGKALVDKLPQMFELMGLVAGGSLFDKQERVKELILEVKAGWDTALFKRGQQVVASRVLSYFSPAAKFNEIGQFTFYKFMSGLERELDGKLAEIGKNLANTARLIFNRDSLLVSITCEEGDYPKFTDSLAVLYNLLGARNLKPVTYHFDLEALNEGIMTAGKVQYVAKGANFRRLGYSYHGSMKVLESILRYDFLWSRIRVQGGAYGAFAQFDRNGNIVFGSYRDPNLLATLQVYDETAQYLAAFNTGNVSRREMTKYVIGAISGMDTPLTPQMKGERATALYIRKISRADIQVERDQVLATGQEDIRRLAALVDAAMKENYLCVMGSEQKIRESQEQKKVFGRLAEAFE